MLRKYELSSQNGIPERHASIKKGQPNNIVLVERRVLAVPNLKSAMEMDPNDALQSIITKTDR